MESSEKRQKHCVFFGRMIVFWMYNTYLDVVVLEMMYGFECICWNGLLGKVIVFVTSWHVRS